MTDPGGPAFLTDLDLIDRSSGRGRVRFLLQTPLVYRSRILGRIRVPAGFATDFASIPRLLWIVLPPVGAYDRAAVVHDYLYADGLCTREEADAVLLEAMRASGVSEGTAGVIYRGVRIGGWWAWRQHRKQDAQIGRAA